MCVSPLRPLGVAPQHYRRIVPTARRHDVHGTHPE